MSTPGTPAELEKTVRDKVVIEAKVIASTAATFVVSLVLAVLNDVEDNHALLGSLPSAAQTVILIVAPAAVTFVGGYLAKHSPRPSDGP